MKRLFDFLFALFFLLLLSPLLLPIIIILLLTGEHKVFYTQQRVGKNGKMFGLIKFATMLSNSSQMKGGDITTQNDPRVLPVGRILRKTKINELPQLINILIGDMSVVGPRPLTTRTFDYYPEELKPIIQSVTPGLTGIGSIVFRDEESFVSNSKEDPHTYYQSNISPFKGQLESWYAENRTFIMDIRIIFLTAWVILFPQSNKIRNSFPSLPKHPIFCP